TRHCAIQISLQNKQYCFFLLYSCLYFYFFFFSSRRRHTRSKRDWSSDVCSSDLCGRRTTSGSRHSVRPTGVRGNPPERPAASGVPARLSNDHGRKRHGTHHPACNSRILKPSRRGGLGGELSWQCPRSRGQFLDESTR